MEKGWGSERLYWRSGFLLSEGVESGVLKRGSVVVYEV